MPNIDNDHSVSLKEFLESCEKIGKEAKELEKRFLESDFYRLFKMIEVVAEKLAEVYVDANKNKIELPNKIDFSKADSVLIEVLKNKNK